MYTQRNLPPAEASPRSFLERLARWEREGRCVVVRTGKSRGLPEDTYARLIDEDSEARRRQPPTKGSDEVNWSSLGYVERTTS